MEHFPIITIGRQVGSGGLQMGRTLAGRLGYAFYDRELLLCAARESGLDPALFEQTDECRVKGLSQALAFGNRMGITSFYGNPTPALSVEHFFALLAQEMQARVRKGPAVFVGRCADYVLRGEPYLLSIFLTAPLQERVGRVAAAKNITPAQALKYIQKEEKQRAAYYRYFTGKTWGAATSYDLCLDVFRLGQERCMEVVAHLVG